MACCSHRAALLGLLIVSHGCWGWSEGWWETAMVASQAKEASDWETNPCVPGWDANPAAAGECTWISVLLPHSGNWAGAAAKSRAIGQFSIGGRIHVLHWDSLMEQYRGGLFGAYGWRTLKFGVSLGSESSLANGRNYRSFSTGIGGLWTNREQNLKIGMHTGFHPATISCRFGSIGVDWNSRDMDNSIRITSSTSGRWRLQMGGAARFPFGVRIGMGATLPQGVWSSGIWIGPGGTTLGIASESDPWSPVNLGIQAESK